MIPVFIPHAGCPHRCLFCNQHSTTGSREPLPDATAVRSIIKRYLAYAKPGRGRVEVAFFGGNFLGLDPSAVTSLLGTASAFVSRGAVDGIRFSTRPDTIVPERLDRITAYPVTTVELGVQSMNDSVLEHVGRGHTAGDTRKAVSLLKARTYGLGLQMMVGLPGDDVAGALRTGQELAELKPDFVRIYPTLVLEGSPLAHRFRCGQYKPMELDACIQAVKSLLLFFARYRIPVVRMGLQPTRELGDGGAVLAGPYHPAFGELVYGAVFKDVLTAHLNHHPSRRRVLTVCVHPSNRSRFQGQRRCNLDALKSTFGFKDIQVTSDATLSRSMILVNGRQCPLPI